jgi:hypothetical protein
MMGNRILTISCGILIVALFLSAACTSPAEKTTERVTRIPSSASAVPTPTVTGGTAAPVVALPDPGIAAPLLGRPTDHSVNVNIFPAEDMTVYLEYRNSTAPAWSATPSIAARSGEPVNSVIPGLAPDTGYSYHVCWIKNGQSSGACGPEYSFHTQRKPGSSFVFAVQADSHLDERASGDLYNRTLAHELAGQPDFLIDLGDTSMSEKLPVKSTDAIRNQYLRQRSYLGTVGSSVPVFLVLGNHDGEAGYALGGKDNSLALLSLQFRKMYFPDPEPDGFYSGNAVTEPGTGLRQDYYAWRWGDALFIVIDPYWYTTSKPGGGKTDGWGWTLGKTQYQWLKETLAKNRAPYTFVFAHQLVGGDPLGRGGIEFAGLYEWGGKNTDGTPGFDQHRPGWGKPIHQLLVENNVTAFFHGHDHIFAKQELDSITYQEVPQPATPGAPNPGTEYGYTSGTMLPSPGHLRITVAPESARVDYIGSAITGGAHSTVKDGEVVYSFTMKPRQSGG